jgi:lipoprotein-releasing system permease protein
VAAVAPAAEGSGIVGRGAKSLGALIIGVVPEDQMRVTSMRSRVVEGDFDKVDQQNAAIGTKMAEDLGVGVGDRINIASNEAVVQTFRVACIFDLGMDQANESRVYVGLHAAQALLKMGKDVTTINVRTKDIFQSDRIANQVRAFSPLKVTSWMESNKAFLDTLKAQNSSAVIIQLMTLLASAFGVASVMIVFVVQKSKDIGILKSMGATSRQIQRIFMLEGLGVGLAGALLGSGIGTGLCFMVESWLLPGQLFGGKPATIVPMKWDITYVMAASAVAIIIGLLSSVVPARRAAKLSPVEAIRHG